MRNVDVGTGTGIQIVDDLRRAYKISTGEMPELPGLLESDAVPDVQWLDEPYVEPEDDATDTSDGSPASRSVTFGAMAWLHSVAQQALVALRSSGAAAEQAASGHDDQYNTPHGAAVLAAYEKDAATYDEEDEGWRAYLASEGTCARFFQQICLAEPELPRREAWYRAEAQARAELAERCPDGIFVPSMHPWDLEYVRRRQADDARRDAALAALERKKAEADQQAADRLAILAARRAACADETPALEGVFSRWEQAITASQADRAERYELEVSAVYNNRPTIEQRIAVTTRAVPLEPDGLDTMLYFRRGDRAAEWQDDPFRPNFERARDGLRRLIASIRGTNQPAETRTPAEVYWDDVASLSEALLAQGKGKNEAYNLAQQAAAHRALSQYDRDVVAAITGIEQFLD